MGEGLFEIECLRGWLDDWEVPLASKAGVVKLKDSRRPNCGALLTRGICNLGNAPEVCGLPSGVLQGIFRASRNVPKIEPA